MTALHSVIIHAGNTSAYYSYYFDYLLCLLFKKPCKTIGIYFR